MIRTKLLCALATLVLGIALAASPAVAASACSPKKNGQAGCKNEIKGCIKIAKGIACSKDPCNALSGKEKRQCKGAARRCLKMAKKTCKSSTKSACAADTAVCSASPSGAFLDAAY